MMQQTLTLTTEYHKNATKPRQQQHTAAEWLMGNVCDLSSKFQMQLREHDSYVSCCCCFDHRTSCVLKLIVSENASASVTVVSKAY